MSSESDNSSERKKKSDHDPENCSDQEKGIDYNVEFESDEGDPFVIESEDESTTVYENKSKTFQWTSVPPKKTAGIVPYDPSSKGFLVDLSTIKTPKSAFLQYMDTFLLEHICRYTNAEAKYAKDTKFEPMTPTSFLAWLAILINAGRTKAKGINVDELWSTDPVYGTLFYRAVMSRHQYESIFRYIFFFQK